MLARITADFLVLAHLGFILFVVLGGLFVIKWNKLAWLHIPCACWGAWIEFSGGTCPLTPLENHFRSITGQTSYSGGFIEHYILPIIYPAYLTRDIQFILGSIVIAINLAFYAIAAYWYFKTSGTETHMSDKK
jgi:hypothetical protein